MIQREFGAKARGSSAQRIASRDFRSRQRSRAGLVSFVSWGVPARADRDLLVPKFLALVLVALYSLTSLHVAAQGDPHLDAQQTPNTPSPTRSGLAPPQRTRWALSETSAFGVTHGGFFNQLVGPRADYRFDGRFAFGASVAYANLKGKSGRAHNVLPELGLEYRIAYLDESLGIPLRFAPGFLPRNGPTLRLSAGLDIALVDRLSLEVMPLETMIWITREQPEVSLNLSAGLRLAL